MRVISRPRLREFWESTREAEKPLRAWERGVKGAVWANWSELKRTFGTADRVGNCVVFDVGGNKIRLIARVMFEKQRVFVLKVMSHAEYDASNWVDECRCHEPPPERKGKR